MSDRLLLLQPQKQGRRRNLHRPRETTSVARQEDATTEALPDHESVAPGDAVLVT